MTLYHRDGDRFDLMREPAFEFDSASNLASPAGRHMRSTTIRFVDDGPVETEWRSTKTVHRR